MRYNREQIISDFDLKPFGSQGWMTNKSMKCPFCGGGDKWGVIFNVTGNATFHCWKCPRKTSVWEFLKKLGRLDLTQKTYTAKPSELSVCPRIEDSGYEQSEWMGEDEVVKADEQKPASLPLRLKPLVDDEYLNSRGFTSAHYDMFEPSFSNTPLEAKLKNFIIFKAKINGTCVAWWARSRYSKGWHDENLKKHKMKEAELILRYRNSGNNFQNILGAADEVIYGKTTTVILVEGIFDKVNVDNILGLHGQDEIKCCFTFGNSIGRGQIDSLLLKGVESVILLYDQGTINESKEAALRMRDLFNTVYVAEIKKEGVDPGNIDISYLEEVLEGATDPINFFYNKIDLKI